MAPVTSGFHHAAMVASDVAKTIRFYRDLLGLRLIKHNENYDDAAQEHLVFGAHTAHAGSLLAFLVASNARRGHWGVGGVHHVALGVADQTAQLKWKRRLTDHGVPVSGPYDRGWFHSIYFSDTDGQILEIATNGPGYDIDEPIDHLGETVAMPKETQVRGHRDEQRIAAQTYDAPVEHITADMTLDGIHHITGITNDVESIGEFYAHVFGLRLVKRSINQDDGVTPHLFWANYDGTRVAKHSSITQFGWPTSRYYARAGPGQTHHVAYRAVDENELLAFRERLREAGIEATPITDQLNYSSIYFQAPDGLLMEIATDPVF